LRRSAPTSRSFVLASLRALHLDPGVSPSRAREQVVVTLLSLNLKKKGVAGY
jgi:hypothetical protein